MQRDYPRVPRDHEFHFVVIFRRTVEACDIDHVLLAIARLQRELGDARLMGRIELFFDGFDDDGREIYEIPEIRRFISRLLEAWPAWAFFLNPGIQLPVVLACVMNLTSTRRSGSRRVQLQFDDPHLLPMLRDALEQIIRQANLAGVADEACMAHFESFAARFRASGSK